MIFADNNVVCHENREHAETTFFERWSLVLESKRMKTRGKKTDYMCVSVLVSGFPCSIILYTH